MAKKISPKKQALADLTLKLSSALPELKTTLGEKKFARRVKKAAKILNAGLKTETKKTKEVAEHILTAESKEIA